MSLALRPYQTDIINEARSLMSSGQRSILITAPTGSGKTVLTAHMLKTAASKEMASWFICHRRELIKQSTRAFSEVGVRHGIVSNGFMEDPRQLVQIASIQTLANRYHRLRTPRLIIWDECHHIGAKSWAKIHEALPDAFHIGLTASPLRMDGQGLGQWFKKMIHGPSVSWLIEQGFLAPYRLFAPTGVNLSGVHTRMGDFVKSELSSVIDKPTITGDAIKHYQRLAHGKRAVVFCVSVEHSKHVVEQFKSQGIAAAHVDGETDVVERDAAVRSFERGAIRVLSNVDLFGEGFDLPSLEVSILLRPTQSLGLYLQQVGRVLRPSPGKSEAIILDHAGNALRHGLPDEEREWKLNGSESSKQSSRDGSPSVRVCPLCFAAQFSGVTVCKFCNHVFELKPREVQQVDGELQEVDATIVRQHRRIEQAKADTLDELVEIGKARGYKRPHMWAKHIHMARQRKKLGVR